jgi:hypothetical protein
MKKISKVLLVAISALFLFTTQSYAEEPIVNRYVQLKDGVVFAYVESTREVGNSILLPPGLTWENVKEKKYENGTFVDAPIIKTVTEIVDNKVAQTNTTVFASDAKGDVVSSSVQLGWHKDNSGTYTSSIPQPSQPSAGSFNKTNIQDTVTVLVNIVGTEPIDTETVTTFTGAATLSVNEKSNYEITTHVQPNGLKVTNFLEATETVFFDGPKTIEQVEASLNNNSMIKRYLNIFFQLLNGWIVIPAVQ